jgi:hypothetical protein
LPVSVLLLVFATLLAGCAETPPSRFYTLTSFPEAQTAPSSPVADVSVGLGPVVLPKYLDRPDIVQRTGAHELSLAPFDKWSEPLDSMVPRLVSENLTALLGSNRVFILPQRRTPPLDYVVEAEILRFDAAVEGEVVLDVQWEVYGSDSEKPLDIEKSTFRETVVGEGYAAVAAAMSRALGRFSETVAESIRSSALSKKSRRQRR